MTTPTVPMRADDVTGYVSAVRARLGDLTPEEVEELTGGLEADIAEALAGTGQGPRARFGDPVAYADELRAAAGIPPRATGSWSPRAVLDARRWSTLARDWWPRGRDYLVVLRPAWWVLRAWVAYRVFYALLGPSGGYFPGGPQGFLVLLVAVAISVELGRRSPFAAPHWRVLVAIANVLAVLLLAVALDAANRSPEYYTGYPVPPAGISRDGEAVSNVFAYDSQGRQLRDVRLYDQDGRALAIGEPDTYVTDGQGRYWELSSPPGLGPDQPRNLFPLRRTPDGGGTTVDVPFPFPSIPPLLVAPPTAPTPAVSVTPTPTPTPTSTPTP